MSSTQMPETLAALLGRNSHPRLAEPGPDSEQLNLILRSAMRAPDHGRLRPWRFVVVSGDRREALGRCFYESLQLRGVSDEAQLAKALSAPMRAPVVIAGMLHAVAHEKISREEQGHAVAAALHGAQLAADALGFGCVWRTGAYATDPHVVETLGGASDDQVIGFLYVGTREGPSKKLPEDSIESLVSYF